MSSEPEDGEATVAAAPARRRGRAAALSQESIIEAALAVIDERGIEGLTMRRLGQALGAAFQVADDILDVEADEVALGKRAGKDAERNKATLVAALGLTAARERRDRLAAEAIAALDQFPQGRKAAILKEAARFAVARKS